MTHRAFPESVVEDAAFAWLEALGYAVLHGTDIVAGEPGAERGDPDYRDVVLERRLRHGAVVVTFGLPGKTIGETPMKAPMKTPMKTTGKTIGKTTGKTPEVVLRLLAEDPNLSVPQLAARLEKSELTIHRAIRKLRESDHLVRVGPDKGGRWQVLA